MKSKYTRVAVLVAALIVPLQGSAEMTRFVTLPGSTVTINGGNNVHDWRIQGSEIGGYAEFGPGFPAKPGATMKTGIITARVEGFIPVRSLHINEGRAMNNAMYEKLREPTNPRILFRFGELNLKSLPETNGGPFILDAHGDLVVAGTTNQFSMSVAISTFDSDKLKITGSKRVKMTDFRVQPLEIHTSSIAIRTRDEMELTFEWILGSPAIVSAETFFREDPLPKILQDWQKRRERAAGIRYELAGTRTWPKGLFNPHPGDPEAKDDKDNPDHDIMGTLNRTVLLDFSRNRFRIEFDDQGYSNLSRSLYRIHCIEMGDGSALRVRILENTDSPIRGNSARHHVDFWTTRGDPQLMPPGIFHADYHPLFYAAGIVPTGEVRVRPTALVPTNDPMSFTFVGAVNVSGRLCARIRAKWETKLYSMHMEEEFWVDVERDSAIVKIISDGYSCRATTEIEYQQTPGGWLPSAWTREARRQRKPTQPTDKIKVKSVSVFPPVTDQDFTFEPTPGMYVQDEKYFLKPKDGQLTGSSKYYRIEADGRRTELNERLWPLGETNAPANSERR